ncbi:MAG: hypothetical protein IJB26_05060 [Clostridia bacterium]|nr:hypothetical protein [Clostridia bacterium]
MEIWATLRRYLPSLWVDYMASLPPEEQKTIQEIRLRANAPVMLSTPTGERFLGVTSTTTLQQKDTVLCRREQLETCFLRFCEESVYAHEEELRQGYIAVSGGIRVGVAATAVLEDGTVRAVRQVSSLCIRLPRRHVGCSATLLPLVLTDDGVRSTLLVSEPSGGKTSLLRDLATTLAARRVRVAVVDERGELGGVDDLVGCDVLRGYPKAVGILQAVRCLAPQVVVFDELGDAREQDAVCACAHAGVAVIASLHGDSPYALQKKASVRRMIEQEVFDRWVFLQGRYAPGAIRECLMPEVTDSEIYWHCVDRDRGFRDGDLLCASAVSARGMVAAL